MNIRSRTLLAFILPFAIFFSNTVKAATSDNSLADLQKKGVLTIANTQTSPPWSFLGTDNKLAGYDVDVANEVARRLGIKKVEFVADTFSNFVDGLKTGKYDLIVSGMAATSERKKVVDFSVPYTAQGFLIWVNDKNTDIKDLASLAGKKVGVDAGTANEVWARAHLTKSEIVSYDNGGFLYNDLATGRTDAVIESHFAGYKTKEINHLPIKEVGEPLTFSLGCIAIPKNEPTLAQAVNQALSDMLADGTVQKIGQKYLGKDYDMAGNIKKALSK
ncbi:amino acid ABC transporter substrate-binding protein (PAAT family) [Paraburkholderia sp. BL6669N2]|uniref:transporter substrate-binding domain-containing protein n=1 Tax=Paraburkholderia sp. BL6669N2 TaxID=1938807 RepID=UPI000E388588|nr:transporter substrate-binding domain-containing protein [Paraburkholderia sp. BL6669N2]REG49609.1 amino acid ABC transporter substrate-binding protein (PAAT family) [Paraburkholderia sp. BL6669N2]